MEGLILMYHKRRKKWRRRNLLNRHARELTKDAVAMGVVDPADRKAFQNNMMTLLDALSVVAPWVELND